MDEKILLRRADLARQLGVSPATIHKWAQLGVMNPSEKRIGGNLYDLMECRKTLKRIEELKQQKKRLSEIKDILEKEK